jgi:hypothetical protein
MPKHSQTCHAGLQNQSMIPSFEFRFRRSHFGVLAAIVVCGFALEAQGQHLVNAALPDSPGYLQAAEQQAAQAPETDARIRGVVEDVSGALVPGATIKLEEEKGKIPLSEGNLTPEELKNLYSPVKDIESNAAGEFEFTNLPAGTYRALITAKGLEPFLSDRFELSAGQHFELPNVALLIAKSGTAINVYATSVEVADAELKLETHQRVLGLAPNYYESFVWNAAPLNTRQKFYLATKSRTDPFILLPTAIIAGVETAHNTFPRWGQDPASYGKRFGAAYGDALFGRFIGYAILPSIFHQDPRYFYMGPSQPVTSRLWHAISAGIIARGDNGRLQPAYAHVLGNGAAGALSTVYHPPGNSAGYLAGRNMLVGIGGNAVEGLFREFILNHFTHNVPGYAKGKPADDPGPR